MDQLAIKIVSTDNPELKDLVAELNSFFIKEWGEDVNTSYANHHQLSSMQEAIVAYVEGTPVGCGCWKLLDKETPEIKRMYVKEEYRGTPVVTEILRNLEETIKKQGFKQMVLETGSEMKGAIRFYEKAGFKIVPNFGEFIDDALCVCLRKELV